MAAIASLSLTPGKLVDAERARNYRKFSANDYQPQFDGLRAIAVLAVMSDHFAADIPNFPLPDWIHLGTTGVRLFLVLSGYFITASLRRACTRVDRGEFAATGALRSFYWRRLLRILPAYGVFACIGLALDLGAMRQHSGWLLTGTVNWLIAWKNDWPISISHLWSICVQEQFYVVWPLVILFLPRRWVLRAIIAAAIAGVGFRVGCVLFSVPLIPRWVLPFGSLDSLAIGAALGWCGARLPPSRGGWPLAIISCVMLAAAAYLRNGDSAQLLSVLVEPLEAVALGILVARTVTGFDGWLGRVLSARALAYAGQISYGLYIYHMLVSLLADRWLPDSARWMIDIPTVRLFTLGTGTLLFATISWSLLEQPINRFRGAKPRRLISTQPIACLPSPFKAAA
jgi:peptidoglycan/LPS O-acetylase OafA/YrhL